MLEHAENMPSRSSSFTSARRAWLARFLQVVSLWLAVGCRAMPAGYLVELTEARGLTADLRVQFGKANDAASRAVMAQTDESSRALARDAEQALRASEADVVKLGPILGGLGYPAEIEAFSRFQRHFSECVKVDRSILALAVENTNLKAQRLSFGPLREAADGFATALAALAAAVEAKQRLQVDALSSQALLAVREIQTLEAPHIAEPDEAAMTRAEAQMARLAATAKDKLKELSALVGPAGTPSLGAASAALTRFEAVHAELVPLSRRNTNVRSLDLALRVKPPLTAACDDSLRSLQTILAEEGSKPSR